jgi:hypothetical protein
MCRVAIGSPENIHYSKDSLAKAAGLCGDGRAVSKLGRTHILQPCDLLKTWTF